MSYYRVCTQCGAHLDPGERCDCLHDNELPHVVGSELPSAVTGVTLFSAGRVKVIPFERKRPSAGGEKTTMMIDYRLKPTPPHYEELRPP